MAERKPFGIIMSAIIDPSLINEFIALGDRLSEDRLYEIAVQEVEANNFDGVAKAKALEEAEGDEKKARAFYVKQRVRRIRDIIAEQAIVAEQERIIASEEEAKILEEDKIILAKHRKIQEDASKNIFLPKSTKIIRPLVWCFGIGGLIFYFLSKPNVF